MSIIACRARPTIVLRFLNRTIPHSWYRRTCLVSHVPVHTLTLSAAQDRNFRQAVSRSPPTLLPHTQHLAQLLQLPRRGAQQPAAAIKQRQDLLAGHHVERRRAHAHLPPARRRRAGRRDQRRGAAPDGAPRRAGARRHAGAWCRGASTARRGADSATWGCVQKSALGAKQPPLDNSVRV